MLVHQKQNLLRCTDTGLLRKETIKELLAWSVLFKWPGLSIRGSGSNSSHNTNICRTKSARTLAKHKCLFENPEHKKILKECFVLGEKKKYGGEAGGFIQKGELNIPLILGRDGSLKWWSERKKLFLSCS